LNKIHRSGSGSAAAAATATSGKEKMESTASGVGTGGILAVVTERGFRSSRKATKNENAQIRRLDMAGEGKCETRNRE
jgi:hypothetical protein